ncbi:MAG: sulfotransferase family protein [Actinomycetota bacterium]
MDTRPIFIVGTLHSGANWVFEFLTSHPDVAGVKDSWALYDARSNIDLVRETGEELIAGVGPAPYVAIKSPANVFAIDEIAAAWPEARFIHVLRDGRDVVVRVRLTPQRRDERTSRLFGVSIPEAAAAWAQATEAGLDAEEHLGERGATIRYEDVLKDRRRAGADIFTHCKIHWDDDLIEDILERDDGRLSRPEDVEAWRSYFSVYRAFKFDRAAGATLRRARYERDPKWWWRPVKR